MSGSGDFGFENVAYKTETNTKGDWNKTCAKIGSANKKIKKLSSDIERATKCIGSSLDSPDNREQIVQSQTTAKNLCKENENSLNELKTLYNQTAAHQKNHRRTTLGKLANEFSQSLQAFQVASEKVVRAQQTSGDNNDFQLPGSASNGQLQQQVLKQVDFAGIERQAAEMAQLEADIMDVNIIFKDLNEMVMDQGTTLDTIEDNVGTAVMDVQEGNKKMEKAVDYARKARNKKICLLITILVVIAIICLIIFIPKK